MEKITIHAHLNATTQAAFDAYTSPEAITQWNFASPEWCCPSAQVDLRVGGIHNARMEARDGSMGFDFSARYSLVDAPSSLGLALDDGREVEIKFDADGSGTKVTVSFDPETQNPLDMQRGGWQAILDNYAKYVNDNT